MVLSPIICILWPISLMAKFFYPALALLLIARVMFFIWPNLNPDVHQFDILLLMFVLFGGFLKFYWWAVTHGSEDDSDEESDPTVPT